MIVYVVMQHINPFYGETRVIGVYGSREKAARAIEYCWGDGEWASPDTYSIDPEKGWVMYIERHEIM